ncbi:MAG: glycosyltransferase family 4 protein [Candidatus Bathyarchaeia archaeon]
MEVALFTVHRAVSFSEVNRVLAKYFNEQNIKTYDLDFEAFYMPRLNPLKGFEPWDVMIGTMTVCDAIAKYFQIYSQSYYSKRSLFYGVCEGEPKITDQSRQTFNKRIVVPSNFCKEELTKVGIETKAVIPHGIVHSEFQVSKQEVEAFRENWKGHKILLYYGNADPRKGVPQMLEALAKVKDKRQDWVLLISTDSRFFQNSILGQPPLDYIINKYKLSHWVVRIGNFGHQSRHDIALWLNSCDLLLLPSFCEGFGIPLIESGACHKTVVCVDAPPMNEIVDDKCAYLVPYRHIEYKAEHPMMIYKKHIWDLDDFAETVLYALDNPQETIEKGEKNYENSLKYSYRNTYSKFLNLIANL